MMKIQIDGEKVTVETESIAEFKEILNTVKKQKINNVGAPTAINEKRAYVRTKIKTMSFWTKEELEFLAANLDKPLPFLRKSWLANRHTPNAIGTQHYTLKTWQKQTYLPRLIREIMEAKTRMN